MSLDLTKPMQTRDGRKARIVCTDRVADDYTLVALVVSKLGNEMPEVYLPSGTKWRGMDCPDDLVNVKTKKSGWINVYPPSFSDRDSMVGNIYHTEQEAINGSAYDRIDTVEIHWEE